MVSVSFKNAVITLCVMTVLNTFPIQINLMFQFLYGREGRVRLYGHKKKFKKVSSIQNDYKNYLLPCNILVIFQNCKNLSQL